MANPRTPTPLKVVRGTERKDRANPAEPVLSLAAEDVAPPRWLRLSPLARRAWRELVPLLRAMGVLTVPDVVALGLLCDALASYVTAKTVTRKEGSVYETVNEAGARMLRAHPIVAQGADASRFAKILLGEFGLTPAARAKVARVGAESKDPLEAWLGEGTGG